MDQLRVKKFETTAPTKYTEDLHSINDYLKVEYSSETGKSNIIFSTQTYSINSDVIGIVQAFVKARPLAIIIIVHNGESLELQYIKGTGI